MRSPLRTERMQPRQHASARGRERRAAGIVDVDVPAQQFGAHPFRQAAIRRDQRRRAARRLQKLAQADGDGQRLLAFVQRLDQTHIGQRRRHVLPVLLAPQRPPVGGVGGTKASLANFSRAASAAGASPKATTSSRATPMVSTSRAEKGLRMGGAGFVAIEDGRERGRIKVLIEPWQHPRALRRAGDGRQQPRRDDIRAGRAKGDDRDLLPCDIFDGAGDKHVLSRRRIANASRGKNPRPFRDGDIEKPQGDPPIIVELAAEVFQPPPLDILDDHFVDQRRQFARQAPGVGGMGRNQQGVGGLTRASVSVDRNDRLFEIARPGRESGRRGSSAARCRQPSGESSRRGDYRNRPRRHRRPARRAAGFSAAARRDYL